MTDVEYFARNIKYLRQLKQFKQEDIASLFNVTSQAVSKWETAKSLPDIKTLLSIAEYFQVTMEDLISTDISNCEIKDVVTEKKEQPRLYSYYSDLQFGKDTTTYLIINIILVVLNIFSIATWFIPINNLISLVVLIIASIVNFVGCPIYFKAISKLKRHALIKEATYMKYLKVAVPVSIVAVLWFITIICVLNESVMWYVLLVILYLLLTIFLLAAAICYQKISNRKKK